MLVTPRAKTLIKRSARVWWYLIILLLFKWWFLALMVLITILANPLLDRLERWDE